MENIVIKNKRVGRFTGELNFTDVCACTCVCARGFITGT